MLKGFLTFILLVPMLCAASNVAVPLKRANVDLRDYPSLQRGAKWYMNYCAGCHSLNHMRFQRIAKDLKIVDKEGNIDKELVRKNLIFTGVKIGDTAHIAMSQADASEWFGVPPPDLTLVARVRGPDWIYTYLNSFYEDHARPWGTNNLLFPEVAMPNVLEHLQGDLIPVFSEDHVLHNGNTKASRKMEYMAWVGNGSMSSAEFEAMTHDIVNFLTYVSEPAKLERQRLGVWVLLFLAIFFVLAYALKREFWKDIK